MPVKLVLVFLTILLSFAIFSRGSCSILNNNDHLIHPHLKSAPIGKNDDEKSAEYWNKIGEDNVKEFLKRKPLTGTAKNVILFLGDGMSVPTLAATRVYQGNENSKLSFDKFPHTAVSKTYCVDYQVPDSACTATAYLTGIKGNMGTIGVDGFVLRDDCAAMTNKSHHINSIAYDFQKNSRSTGLVTTTRVTHASPAGVYAHTSERNWECDRDMVNVTLPRQCTDIATQLINGEVGRNLNVIMGGGRNKFLPKSQGGERLDDVDLIELWKSNKNNETKYSYVRNRDELFKIDNDTEYLLGLFNVDHINYNLERDVKVEPSLEEMTESAIKVLSRNENGYFLFVEGGKIDLAHHANWARKALDETLEFSKAVAKAVEITNEEDTLIIITSDHAHTMSFAGYPIRQKDIFEMANVDNNGIPFTTLSYANGPGYVSPDKNGSRHDPSKDDQNDINYRFPAFAMLYSETHGGDDVLIFAQGPWAHLFSGVMEQNTIAHVMKYASSVGDTCIGSTGNNASSKTKLSMYLVIALGIVLYILL